jgi:hypothetical protein
MIATGLSLAALALTCGWVTVALVRHWRACRHDRRMVDRAIASAQADARIAQDAATYSPDVELNEHGIMVFTRDIVEGEVFMLPLHMLETHRQNGGQ